MNEQQGNGVRSRGLLVHKMNVKSAKAVNLDIGMEMWVFIELLLGRSPIMLLPCSGQSFDICQRATEVPSGLLQLVWKVSKSQFLLEAINLLLRHVDAEWLGGGHGVQRRVDKD